jgi:hypothetical protein
MTEAPDINKERGYGLFLMSHMVDHLDVVSGENTATVRLIKKPRKQQPSLRTETIPA